MKRLERQGGGAGQRKAEPTALPRQALEAFHKKLLLHFVSMFEMTLRDQKIIKGSFRLLLLTMDMNSRLYPSPKFISRKGEL
ncbi:hypothetical protein [Cytobacillus sp. IB215665]|uniref:hypothetical protein n=1 Tax=Cytobacillus sp. IB215665 TaxID=3097357 RepID=UPI002A0D3F1D|nr:hypothetical protein [Cytobacillus sp. IB215665]MDX8363678.1 hypothetical protein [Cytobacillus sp. IB215665]